MLCPQCENEMKYRKDYLRYFSTFLEEDHERYYLVETFSCKMCQISCKIDHSGYSNTETWEVPEFFSPSIKQLNAINFIEQMLRMDASCHTKRQATPFIRKYLSQAIQEKDRQFAEWCEDNQDWLPQEFD